MAGRRMPDNEHREQQNNGSGTFVGGDVHGGFWQIFLPPYGKNTPTPSTSGQPNPDGDNADDYEDRYASLIGSAVLIASGVLAVVNSIMGWAWDGDEMAPGVAERVCCGIFAAFICIAATAAFFARLAQVFELWSEQCAITAVQNRGHFAARPPAALSRAMAATTAVAAVAAELLATLVGWSSFGGDVARRAHSARLNAAVNATSAEAAKAKVQ